MTPFDTPFPPLLYLFWSNSDLSIANWLLTNKSPYRVDTCVKAFWRPFWATFFGPKGTHTHTHTAHPASSSIQNHALPPSPTCSSSISDNDSITITISIFIFICNFCSVFIFIFISYVSNFTCSNFKVSMKLTIVIWCCSWWRWWWARRWRWRRRWCYRKPKPSSILTLINSSKPQRGEFAQEKIKKKNKQFQFRFQFDFRKSEQGERERESTM